MTLRPCRATCMTTILKWSLTIVNQFLPISHQEMCFLVGMTSLRVPPSWRVRLKLPQLSAHEYHIVYIYTIIYMSHIYIHIYIYSIHIIQKYIYAHIDTWYILHTYMSIYEYKYKCKYKYAYIYNYVYIYNYIQLCI